jgi:hypothetical protein
MNSHQLPGKLIGLCAVFMIVISCQQNLSHPPGPPAIIKIEDGYASGLVLKDDHGRSAQTFVVHGGTKIQWILKNNTAVDKIDNIFKKDASINVFAKGPSRIGGSRNWEGTTEDPKDVKVESYNIQWTDTAGQQHTFDPLIQVNPKK